MHRFFIGLCFLFLLAATGCRKFLDAKPDKRLAVPSSPADLMLLLDNSFSFTEASTSLYAHVTSDDFYWTDGSWNGFSQQLRDWYCWKTRDAAQDHGWTQLYKLVYTCNVVLDELPGMSGAGTAAERREVEGAALFYRARAYCDLADIFTRPYDATDASVTPGLVLRADSDFSTPSRRSTLEETYQRITEDLARAAALLPESTTAIRPGRAAAFALLSRTFLQMGRYADAGRYADSALSLRSGLLDYNNLSATGVLPEVLVNPEILLASRTVNSSPINLTHMKVAPDLLGTFKAGDFRKEKLMRLNTDGSYAFRGSYYAATVYSIFTGLAVDELYVTRAECLVRAGEVEEGMRTLNRLLEKRYDRVLFVPETAGTPDEALTIVLAERRKTLAFRGRRWADLRRFSLEPSRAVVPERLVNGVVFRLSPGDETYTGAIPAQVIAMSGIAQN